MEMIFGLFVNLEGRIGINSIDTVGWVLGGGREEVVGVIAEIWLKAILPSESS